MATTVAATIINQIITKQNEIDLLTENLEDLIMDLVGMEITYEGKWAMVDRVFADEQMARLYVEEEYEESYYEVVPLEELLQYVRG
jgi:hypothetical protein